MRINIYKQIRGFYSLVFESKYEFRPTHISLYMFLLNQNNRTNWTEWFKCPFDTIMMGACINSNKTYYLVLKDLESFGLIKYKKGINNHKAPKINIIPLQVESSDIPIPEDSTIVKNTHVLTRVTTWVNAHLSTHQSKQLDTHLSTQLSTHKDILIKGNYKIIIESVHDSKSEVLFESFWDSYHLKTKILKSDRIPAEKYWKKLSEEERQKAIDNIKLYYDSIKDKKFIKKARTYLSDKNFNDEFKIRKFPKGAYSELPIITETE